LAVLCDDGRIYLLPFTILEKHATMLEGQVTSSYNHCSSSSNPLGATHSLGGGGADVELVYRAEGVARCDKLRASVPRPSEDYPTTAAFVSSAINPHAASTGHIMVGRSSGNISVLSLDDDFVSLSLLLSNGSHWNSNDTDETAAAATCELKEPLMKRLFGGLGGQQAKQNKQVIGILPLGESESHSGTAVVAVHASGMMRLWRSNMGKGKLVYQLQQEQQVPDPQQESNSLGESPAGNSNEGVLITSCGLHQEERENSDKKAKLLHLCLNHQKRGTSGLLVLQVVYDSSSNRLDISRGKVGFVSFPSSYTGMKSVCGVTSTLLCGILQTAAGETEVKTIKINSKDGSLLVRDVRQRANVLLDWVPKEAALADFDNPQVLLPWAADHRGNKFSIETYVKQKLLSCNSLDVDTLALTLHEIGRSVHPAACLTMSADQLMSEIEVAIGYLASQAGHSTPKTQHWLHFLRLYTRFWKERHSCISLAVWQNKKKGGEAPHVLTIKVNGGIGILREADGVEMFSFWNHHGNTEMVQFRRAMRAAEEMVGVWNKSLCMHLLCMGEGPYEVTRHISHLAVQAKFCGASSLNDDVERARLSQRLKERRFNLFEIISTIRKTSAAGAGLEDIVKHCLCMFTFRPSPSSTGGSESMDYQAGEEKYAGGNFPGLSIGSVVESLSHARLEMFTNFLITLQLYSLASQWDIYAVLKHVDHCIALDLQTVKFVYLISSLQASHNGKRQGFSLRSDRVRFGNKTRKISGGPLTYQGQESLVSKFAASESWDWSPAGSKGKGGLLSEALSFCQSFCIPIAEGEDATKSVAVMVLQINWCLYTHQQINIIHSVLDSCEKQLSHTAEFRFIRGLGCVHAATEADVAEVAFFSAINGVTIGSRDLKSRIHLIKQQLQGTTSANRIQISGEEASLSKLDYYQTITLLFRRANNPRGAVKFTLAAIAQVRNSEAKDRKTLDQEEGKLWTTLFELFLDLEMWNEAYLTVMANPIGASSVAALNTLVITLFEADKVGCLCKLPLVGSRNAEWNNSNAATQKRPVFYLNEVENSLLWHCDHISIDSGTNPYLPLYSFYTNLHKHRDAAGVMLRYARRLETGESSNFSMADIQSHYRSLLAAHNSLSLVDEDFRWVENPDFVKHHHQPGVGMMSSTTLDREGNEGGGAQAKDKQVVSLAAVKCELIASKARVMCCELCDDISPQSWFFHTSLIGICEVLTKRGKYELVMDLVHALPEDRQRERDTLLNILAIELAKHCISTGKQHQLESIDTIMIENGIAPGQSLEVVREQTQSWGILKEFLKNFDNRYCNYRLRVIVADTLLTEKRNICMPQWLVDSFKSDLALNKSFRGYADLLNVLIKHELVSDACAVAIEMLQSWKIHLADPRARQKSGALCVPYTLLDALAAKLEGQQDQSLRGLKDTLEDAIQAHFQHLEIDSSMAIVH
jgi:hypothetical protein